MNDAIDTTTTTTTATTATSDSDSSSAGKCPVDHKTRSLWGVLGIGAGASASASANNAGISQQRLPNGNIIPASLEEAARHAQTPHPNQRLALSTHRLESTIPRTGSASAGNSASASGNDEKSNIPAHQIQLNESASSSSSTSTSTSKDNDENTKTKENENENNSSSSSSTWVYPSEQQVFNAMKRKGWKGIEEESIPSFLQIHNSVNERSWQEVIKWEQQQSSTVELSRFEGRPKDLSPKAWFLSTFMFYEKPFDRHDWYVVNKKKDNNNGSNSSTSSTSTSVGVGVVEEKRYILDFYMTNDGYSDIPKVEIDVRPALDTPQAFVQRGTQLLRELFPGISRELDDQRQRQL